MRPRRATVAQRLQTNASLEAFEEADIFANVSGYLSDVRVDIGDHVKAGQVLAVIDVPEMKQELAEAEAEAELESKKSSLESARRQIDHNKANLALQNALAKDREQLGSLPQRRDPPWRYPRWREPDRVSGARVAGPVAPQLATTRA